MWIEKKTQTEAGVRTGVKVSKYTWQKRLSCSFAADAFKCADRLESQHAHALQLPKHCHQCLWETDMTVPKDLFYCFNPQSLF